jgi:hypothetical protein
MSPLTRQQRAKIQEKLRNDIVEYNYCHRVRDELDKEFVVTWSDHQLHFALRKSYDAFLYALNLRIKKYEKILDNLE